MVVGTIRVKREKEREDREKGWERNRAMQTESRGERRAAERGDRQIETDRQT